MHSPGESTTTDAWVPPAESPQARALAHVTAISDGPPLDPSLRVTLHFHPDRLRGNVHILASLEADGLYHSQFETGISNGWLDPMPGGSRWRWESHIFAGAYDDAPSTERPKYGALNYRRRPTGGSTRFGSAYLRLGAHVLARCTFCFPDGSTQPTRFGVGTRMSLIADAMHAGYDPIDDHIEAQVHGPVRLASDVEALVLDTCYRNTDVEALARRLPCPLEWHPGFVLGVETLRQHPSFRGPEYVDLGIAIARDGLLTPRILGDAARTGKYDLQDLKKVWHYLARFGDRSDASDTVSTCPAAELCVGPLTAMKDSKARARAKADAQAAIDAADAALAAGAITEREWQHRVTDALAGAYLSEADPRWQAGFHGDSELWRKARELVLDAVPRDGTLLDVGCATGHLMECLATWGVERGLALTVAGLELHPALADAARRRLPEWADRIYTGNVSDWCPATRFDYVRTGLEYVAPGNGPALIRRLLRELVAPGGRLIVGPVYERDVPDTVAAFRAAGAAAPQVVTRADRNGKIRAIVWASPGDLSAPAPQRLADGGP